MRKPPFVNTRAVFATWAAFLAAFLAAGVLANVALSRYVEHQRAQDPRTHLNEAELLIDRNDMVGAFTQIEQAIRKAPGNPEPYRVRGLLHFRLKRLQEAFDSFARAIERGSRDEDMRLKAMNALMQMGRQEEAIAFGRKCLDEGYRYPTFPRYMAETYRALGKPAEAVPYYEEALKGYPNDLFLMDRLAQAYRATGQTEKAAALERRIAETQALQERPAENR